MVKPNIELRVDERNLSVNGSNLKLDCSVRY